MIKIEKQEDVLTIGGFPAEGMNLEFIQQAHDKVLEFVRHDITTIKIELGGVHHEDFSALVFIKFCGELAFKKKLDVKFTDASVTLLEPLKKMGFDLTGNYTREDFRKLKPKSVFVHAGEVTLKLSSDAKSLVKFTKELFKALFYYLCKPNKLNWRETFYYIDQTGADAVPIVLLICFLMGIILAFQGLAQLGKFGLDIYAADLVGFAIIRELGPLMVAMICTGRAGSAFAAELGTMKVAEEIDAMKTMGLKPIYVLVVPKIVGLVFVMPLLTILGDVTGVFGGAIIVINMTDISFQEYMMRVLQAIMPLNVLESLTKSFVFAFLIAAIGCFRGFQAENDAKSVGSATTSSVVSGIFLIIIADTAVTFTFPQIMHMLGFSY